MMAIVWITSKLEHVLHLFDEDMKNIKVYRTKALETLRNNRYFEVGMNMNKIFHVYL